MTRKQAEKIARTIVEAARQANIGNMNWERTELRLDQCGFPAGTDMASAMDDFAHVITGVLPMGWRIGGARGLETVIIIRRI